MTTKLKKKAWDLCSQVVRRRAPRDADGLTDCYTCPKKAHWKQLQAGHLIGGRGNSILFDLRGIRPQCYGCNCKQQGRTVEFLCHLEEEIGQVAARALRDELRFKSKQPHHFEPGELEAIIEELQDRLLFLER